MHDTANLCAPGADTLRELAETALSALPAIFRDPVRELVILIEEFPDEATMEALSLETPFDILGLYHAVDLTQKTTGDPPEAPGQIFLYRRPILDYWCESGEDLAHIVRHVLIHEIGHHFGLSDEAMEAIEEKEET